MTDFPSSPVSETLKPCPFCGSTDIDPTFVMYANDAECSPGCNDCGATAESAEKWNTRADGHAPCQQQWQPIETAPKDGTAIIVTDCRVKEWTQIAFWDTDRPNGYVWARDDASTFWHKDMFTHWMPVPTAPALADTSTEGNSK